MDGIKTLNQKEKRDADIKSMSKVLALPSGSPERWNAAYKHFLQQRPEAKEIDIWIRKQVKARRVEVNKYASSKYGRQTMMAPAFLRSVLRNTDPEYFINIKSNELVEPKHLEKMKRAFPQFFLPEII